MPYFVLFKASGADQARSLLDILPYRGPKAFENFVESLREDYDWLADDLGTIHKRRCLHMLRCKG